MTAAAIDRPAIESWLAARIGEIAGIEAAAVDRTAAFADYGLTSSDAVGLSGELEEMLGRTLSETLLYEFPTIESVSAALAGPTAAARPAGIGTRSHPDDPVIGITGLACRFPGGADSPELFWRNLADGVDAAAEVPPDRWDATACFDPDPGRPGTVYTTRGAFVDDLAGFDARFFGISPREAARMDPQQRMLLEVSWAALEDAGLSSDRLRTTRTGVFVGMMADGRYANLLVDRGGHGELDDPYLGLGNASSVVAGRLSYLLDLRGPSVVIDTACSSSLVALHLAVNSIRNGDCDRAVVAGVGATVHPNTFLQACKMRMLAADGRCKTFDAAADGFLLGEGCGAVVIERAGDAAARQRRVLAVVRGSAVNQDGTSNGLTAPNPAAQVAVVREAHLGAGIDPDDVGYVEAHGSGTQLGDAMEIAALTEVFGGRAASRPLYVGAVKTNIGHLTGAAGIAGLIKAVLVLGRRTIPRNLHLSLPNPTIDWTAAPVRLPHENIRWPGTEIPVAGVSSFGWSGTNAHVVLAAAPPAAKPDPGSGRWHVLPLSGRAPRAVTDAARAVAEHLRANPGVDPADLAATLQSGRTPMPHRAAVAFRTIPEAVRELDEIGRRIPVRAVPRGAPPAVRFVVPGTGDQFPGMARELYRSEPAFRTALDQCAEVAADALGCDLRAALYPQDSVAAPDPFAALRRGPAAPTGELVTRIDLAHAVVFALGYASAQLWQAYGIEPTGLLGYSLGEYTAACLAGVIELQVALPLVVRRARLVASAAPGAMLTVATSAERIVGYLRPGLSCAALNSPTTVVVAGPELKITALEHRLSADGIASRAVPATRAMHTPLLDPLRAELRALFDNVPLHKPRIPLVSNLTGSWITDDQARDPGYWAEHLCSPVQFADGVQTLVGSDPCVAVDLGAGQLASLVGQNVADRVVAIPTLRGAAVPDPGPKVLCRSIGRLWAAGAEVDWPRAGARGASISLPTYSFQHQRFWPDAGPAVAAASSGPEVLEPHWAAAPATGSAVPGRGPYLVFTDPGTRAVGLAALVLQELDGADCVTVVPGTAFEENGSDGYRVRPDNAADHQLLLGALAERDLLPATVIHLWSVSGTRVDPVTAEGVNAHRRRGFDSLMALVPPLGGHCVDGCRVLVVTDHAQLIDPADVLYPGKTTVIGPALVAGQEHPGLSVRLLDVLTPVDDPAVSWPAVAAAVVGETCWPGTDTVLAQRGRRRLARRFRPLALDPPARYVRDGGVYLVTGGTGQIGLRVAARLAHAATDIALVLLARSPLPEDDEQLGAAPEQLRARALALRELRESGARVEVVPCDIGDAAAAATAVAAVRRRYGPIDGVVHAAGVLAPEAFTTIAASRPEFRAAHFRAKVDGTLALAAALHGERPDFVVLLSSMAAVLGGIGFATYAAANAFQDHFVTLRNLPGGSAWRAACWDTWQDTVRPAGDGGTPGSLTEYSFPPDAALAVLDRLVADGPARAVVSAGRLRERLDAWAGGDPFEAPVAEAPDGVPTGIDAYRERLARLWQDALGIDRVGPHDDFFEYGGNSLVGLQLVTAINRQFRVAVPTETLFEAPTVADMAEYLRTATATERKSRV
ncbi:type I polyketide synthase [Nocardia harenae]|uniref:type I polyketide synthase n=1 Tax=Nocardia harenae TaxID=358707 RepID=UPI000830D0C6|nr:type I polyketide synthase [Nocardia harenae]